MKKVFNILAPAQRDLHGAADIVAASTWGEVQVLDVRQHLGQYAYPEQMEPVFVEVNGRRYSPDDAAELANLILQAADYAVQYLSTGNK